MEILIISCAPIWVVFQNSVTYIKVGMAHKSTYPAARLDYVQLVQ